VFTRFPVAVEATVPLTVYVAVPPTAKLISSLMLPEPLAVPDEPTPANAATFTPSGPTS
jgi:hypothetical protein